MKRIKAEKDLRAPRKASSGCCTRCGTSLGGTPYLRLKDVRFCRDCMGSFKPREVLELLEYGRIVGLGGKKTG